MARIEIMSGKAEGKTVELNSSPCTLGNRRSASIELKDPWVSFNHAQITCEGGRYYVADQRSKMGTFINGKKIDRTPVALKSGDTFSLGKTEIRFVDDRPARAGRGDESAAEEEEEAPAPPPTQARGAAAQRARGPSQTLVMPSADAVPAPPPPPAAPDPAVQEKMRALESERDRVAAEAKALRDAVVERERVIAQLQARLHGIEEGAKRATQAFKSELLAGATSRESDAMKAEIERWKKAYEDAVQKARMTQSFKADASGVQLESLKAEAEKWKHAYDELVTKARAKVEELTRKNAELEHAAQAAPPQSFFAPIPTPPPIASSAELDEMKKKLADAEKKATDAKAALDDADKRASDAERELGSLRVKLDDTETELSATKAKLGAPSAADAEVKKLKEELKALEAALAAKPAAAAEDDGGSDFGQVDDAEPAAGADPKALAAAEARAAELAEKNKKLEAKVAELQTELTAANAKKAPAPAAPAAAASDPKAAELAEKNKKLEAKIAELQTELGAAAKAKPAAAPAPAAAGPSAADLDKLKQENENLKKQLESARSDLESINNDMLEQEEELRGEIQKLESEIEELKGAKKKG